MNKQRAIDIIYCLLWGHTHRALAEAFGDSDDQGTGEDLVEDACGILNIKINRTYETQDKCLNERKKHLDLLKDYIEMKCETLGFKAPTFRGIFDRTLKGEDE